jgi:hypothetical protein
MRCLLDKGVVRRAIEGWTRKAAGRSLLLDQEKAVELLMTCPFELCISIELCHILTHIVKVPQASLILEHTIVLFPTRYHRRWARRLRELNFTREDAKILACGSFATDERKEILGVNFIVTCDQALRNKYELDLPKIERQFLAMRERLRPPYTRAALPRLLTLEEFLL